MTTIALSPNYGFVLLTLLLSLLLNILHSVNTSLLRSSASVPYPLTYAPSSRTDLPALRFNGAQRAHAQFTEHFPSFLVALLVAGLKFPVLSSVLGVWWVGARFMYMRGYSLGEEKGMGRYKGGGMGYIPAGLGLYGLVGWMGVGLVMGW